MLLQHGPISAKHTPCVCVWVWVWGGVCSAVCYQPIRLALAFSVSLRTRPFDEVPKVMDESSNSSCLCSSSESSSMYHADRRPWFRVRMDPPALSPASSLGDSLRLDLVGVSCGGGVTSSFVLLLLLLSGEGSGDSAGGAGSSVLVVRGRPRRLGGVATPESDITAVSCADEVPHSSPVDWSRSSSGMVAPLSSSISCLLFLPLFLPGGRPRGLAGLPGVVASTGLAGASTRDFRLFFPSPRIAWLLWPFRWTVLWDEGLSGAPARYKREMWFKPLTTISCQSSWHNPLPDECRTGGFSFLLVLPPLLLSIVGEGVTFSGTGGVKLELWPLSRRVDSEQQQNSKVISSSSLIVAVSMAVHAHMALPAVFCALFVALCVEVATGGVCVELRAALRVRPPAGASALPLTSWGACLVGTLCLSDGGREGAGDGSLFVITLDDMRLFLSGLQRENM